MLVAAGVDRNDQLFLLAFAIVEDKNNDSWRWFMGPAYGRGSHCGLIFAKSPIDIGAL